MEASSAAIRLIVSDVDGVWTRGNVLYGETGETKEFNIRDGLGVKLAQQAGIEIAVLTSRSSQALERRCRELGVGNVVQGAADKLAETTALVRRLGLTMAQVCYIGDDLPDLAPISAAAISAAPADAAPEVLEAVTWRLEARGGEGALRELVERLLKQRGEWSALVQSFVSGSLKTTNP
jgi:3-deoxy-D-manno-octulosonate 8-phosphate phosphatase (KDO 8-P phosphatase)